MNSQDDSTIFPPEKWCGDNWDLGIFYNSNENSNNLERKIGEINFTYKDHGSNNENCKQKKHVR